MTPLPSAFRTDHVGLNVSQLARSRDFYAAVFGFSVLRESEDATHRYAFLGDEDRVVLTLWQQSDGAFDAHRPGLHHLAFRVGDIAEVEAAEQRVRALGATLHHGGIVPHAEGQASGGIFFEDPDGIRLEISTAAGAEAHGAAPSGAAPTCGFF